ncbi:MAG: glycoside hydrolase, partial [Bacilli bacterium]|nr:glycoside hydrolase [Bacilli bacterium]
MFSSLLFSLIYITSMSSLLQTNSANFNSNSKAGDWSKAAQIIKVDDSILHTPIASTTEETYMPSDRQWEGLPSTVCTGNRIWSTWYTGGTKEPHQYNYLVVAYSDDNGKNWVDPYYVIDHIDDDVSLVVPEFWMDGDVLCLTYVQSYTWMIRFHNPDTANINDIIIDEPIRISNSKFNKNPTILKDSDGSSVYAIASEAEVGDTHQNVSKIFVSKSLENNPMDSWQRRGKVTTSIDPSSRVFAESQIVELDFGKWLLISRLDNGLGGGIETSISTDFGWTWEPYKNSLNEPFIGPGSKGHAMRLSSGNILVINHDNTAERSSLCAYLSSDKGLTYPYKMVIDERNDVSYPYAQERNGKIYVSWDKGRYIEKEIRLSIITEEDIKAGEIVGKDSFDKLIINKLNPEYKEVASLLTQFKQQFEFNVGTPSSEVRNLLPTSITVKDNLGDEHTIKGIWKSAGYTKDKAGKYYFTFDWSSPSKLVDTLKLLKVTVTLTEKSFPIGGLIAIIAGGT